MLLFPQAKLDNSLLFSSSLRNPRKRGVIRKRSEEERRRIMGCVGEEEEERGSIRRKKTSTPYPAASNYCVNY